jgi:hypothetical protein
MHDALFGRRRHRLLRRQRHSFVLCDRLPWWAFFKRRRGRGRGRLDGRQLRRGGGRLRLAEDHGDGTGRRRRSAGLGRGEDQQGESRRVAGDRQGERELNPDFRPTGPASSVLTVPCGNTRIYAAGA